MNQKKNLRFLFLIHEIIILLLKVMNNLSTKYVCSENGQDSGAKSMSSCWQTLITFWSVTSSFSLHLDIWQRWFPCEYRFGPPSLSFFKAMDELTSWTAATARGQYHRVSEFALSQYQKNVFLHGLSVTPVKNQPLFSRVDQSTGPRVSAYPVGQGAESASSSAQLRGIYSNTRLVLCAGMASGQACRLWVFGPRRPFTRWRRLNETVSSTWRFCPVLIMIIYTTIIQIAPSSNNN